MGWAGVKHKFFNVGTGNVMVTSLNSSARAQYCCTCFCYVFTPYRTFVVPFNHCFIIEALACQKTLLILYKLKFFLQAYRADGLILKNAKGTHSHGCQVVERTHWEHLFNIIFVFLEVADHPIRPVDLLVDKWITVRRC